VLIRLSLGSCGLFLRVECAVRSAHSVTTVGRCHCQSSIIGGGDVMICSARADDLSWSCPSFSHGLRHEYDSPAAWCLEWLTLLFWLFWSHTAVWHCRLCAVPLRESWTNIFNTVSWVVIVTGAGQCQYERCPLPNSQLSVTSLIGWFAT